MKLAIVLFAGSDTSDGTGRMANALVTALEAQDAGDEVRIVFDGAGTTWLKAPAEGANVPLLDDYKDHPSIRGMLADGFHVLTF